MRLPGLVRGRNFRDLLIGQSVSSFGDWMATVALMALVLDLTGSAMAVGGILALRLMPSLFAGPVATYVAIRFDRKRTMLAMDLVRAPLVALIPLIDQLWWIYTLAFVTELANLVFLPARDAAVPDIIDDERELPTANGLVLATSYGNIPLGAGAFAAIQALVPGYPYWVVFIVDAATYLVSFSLISRIEVRGSAEELGGEGGGTVRQFVNALRMPLLRAVLPGLATIVIGVGALFSLGIVYVREVLGASNFQFGLLIVIFGLGAVAAIGWMQAREADTEVAIVRWGVAAMGVLLAAMSLISYLYAAMSVAVFFGAAATVALVGAITYLQEQLEGSDRVLGLTAFHVVFRVGMSVSAIGAGAAADLVAPVRVPLFGRIEPSSLVLFAAGIFVIVGAATIRPERVGRTTEGTT